MERTDAEAKRRDDITADQLDYLLDVMLNSLSLGTPEKVADSDWVGFIQDIWSRLEPMVTAPGVELSEQAQAKYECIKRELPEKIRKISANEEHQARIAETKRAAELATDKGAIMSIDRRLTAFSTKEYQASFTPGCIMRIPNGVNMKSAFDSNGMLDKAAISDAKLEELDQVQEAFLGTVASMVEDVARRDDVTSEVTFSLPKIMFELGIDPRAYSKKRELAPLDDLRVQRMLEFIDPFDRCVGVLPDGSFYKVLTFGGYDAESKTMTIYTPYIFQLARRAQQAAKGYRHRYLHGDVITEKNLAAVELANRIICGIVQRGLTTDYAQGRKGARDNDTVSYTPTYRSLIDGCPTLKKQLDAIENPPQGKNGEKTPRRKNWNQLYNTRLRNAFESAFRIIETKSDMPNKYNDLRLPTTRRKVRGVVTTCYDVPTKSTLKNRMTITHRGKKRT